MTALAPTLQAFFTDRLALQRQASGHTVAAYRDALKLLIVFAGSRHEKPLPGEHRRPGRTGNRRIPEPFRNRPRQHRPQTKPASPRSTPCSASRAPSSRHAADIQRVLAIPPKRFDQALITYLTEDEITALLAAPDLATWTGRRDQALLMLACQTGLRATELTRLTSGDVHLGTGAQVPVLAWEKAETTDHPTHQSHHHCPAGLARRTRRPAR